MRETALKLTSKSNSSSRAKQEAKAKNRCFWEKNQLQQWSKTESKIMADEQ